MGVKSMPSEIFQNADRLRKFRVLAMCWVAYGLLSVATAIWLAIFVNTATVMFGALLNRVPDPFTMMSAFHFIYWILAIISGVSGVLGILAGCAILTAHPSGRILAIVASFFSLSFIPLGTTLGIFTIIEMLAISPTPLQEAHSELRTPYLKHPPLASSR